MRRTQSTQNVSTAKRRAVECTGVKRSHSTDDSSASKRRVVECAVCHMTMRADDLSRHMKIHNPTNPCKFCNKQIRLDKLLKHETLCKDNAMLTRECVIGLVYLLLLCLQIQTQFSDTLDHTS